VAGVFFQLNDKGWTQAAFSSSSSKWQAEVQLVEGSNTLRAYATDSSGNLSKTAMVTFTYQGK